MKKNKSVKYILLAIVIATIVMIALVNKVLSNDYTTGNYITDFNFDNWKIDRLAGISFYGTDGTYADGFTAYYNTKFYCVENGQGWFNGAYRLASKIVIEDGKIIECQRLGANHTVKSISPKGEEGKTANLVLSEIIRQANASGRTRGNWGDALNKDVYQHMMWQYLSKWEKANFTTASGYITSVSDSYNSQSYAFSEQREEAKNNISAIETKVAESNYANSTYVQKQSKSNVLDKCDIAGNNMIIGPFKYSYGGSIQSLNIYYNDNQKDKSSAQIGTYNGKTFQAINNISNLPNGKEFYISIPSNEVAQKQKLNIYIKVKGKSETTKTTLYIWSKASGDNEYAQNLIYTDQTLKQEEKETTDSYTLNLTGNVSITKKGASDKALEGVVFEIYDDKNNKVGELTTKSNGTTDKLEGLKINKVYQIREKKADIYGYRGRSITKDSISITNGSIEKVENGVANFKLTSNGVITIKNTRYLRNIEINKIDSQTKKSISDVSFVVRISSGENYGAFLALYDAKGNFVSNVSGKVTINENNIATDSKGTQYRVKYENLGKASLKYSDLKLDNLEDSKITTFTTNSDGKVIIENVEVYADLNTTYNYTAYEVSNKHYGYVSSSNIGKNASTGKLIDGNATISIPNDRNLGNIFVHKVDEENEKIVLANVGFVIENYTKSKGYAYIVLYDSNNKVVKNVTGTATINENNKATGSEYRVEYKYFGKPYNELEDDEKSQITTFTTDKNGELKINNLEKYSYLDGAQITYKLIEVYNPHSGYVAETTEFGNITIENGTTFNATIKNKQIYIKITGYVWVENASGKSNTYDGVYTTGDNSKDKKLTDLYVTDKDKKVTKWNQDASVPVQVKLRNKNTKEWVKEQPTYFDEDGKYTFDEVLIEDLANYEVVFVYNGFYYTTLIPQTDIDNGSKVAEVESERVSLNEKFNTVTNSGIVGTDNQTRTVNYDSQLYKDLNKNDSLTGQASTVSGFGFDANVTANTTEAKYNLLEQYKTKKLNASDTIEGIDNVNMGIVLREQPNISLVDDMYSALVEFEGYKYNYDYNSRRNHFENTNNDDIGVRFEQDRNLSRYTRTVYSSDIQAAKDYNKEISVSITYRIQIANKSTTLKVLPKQLINYFDNRYNIKTIGLQMDNENHIATNELNKDIIVQSVTDKYNSAIINLNQVLDATTKTENNKDPKSIENIYITFSISREAILDLLEGTSTYYNASEIYSYATYYGEVTEYAEGKKYTTDKSAENAIYAGIDRTSRPGNMEIKLVDHPTQSGTQILDNSKYEYDTDEAPALILEATGERKVSGTIWEDKATNTANNQRLGNGIYESGEKAISNVKVELYTLNQDGTAGNIATYSNGVEVSSITDENGNYTFGYYDEANHKHVGILPGRYVIKYTYNNETKITGANINVNDYKSTIITSDVIKNAFNGQNERWFTINEANRYSDARDNITLRPEYNANIDKNITVTNSTYNNVLVIQTMEANTPIMNIGIEFTELDTADALKGDTSKQLTNVDFGIIERPYVDIEVEKQITSLEILAQDGTAIISKDDPSNPEVVMQFVRTGLKGIVPVEIEPGLLQGAELKLGYTISINNNSDIDYVDSDYYYYGTNGRTERIPKVLTLVDYLDATMTLDADQTENKIWTSKTVDELFENGYIDEEIYNQIKALENVQVFVTDALNDVGIKDSGEVQMYTTRYLAVSVEAINETNDTEIVELSGVRTIKQTIPGNYDPTRTVNTEKDEPDADKVDLVITPPTGNTVNYTAYIIATTVTSIILVVGIVIIKKKIVK